jgi:vibriolysin
MSKNVVRGALFLALTGAGACAISDVSSKKDGEAQPAMEEVQVSAEQAIASQGNMAASAASYIASNLMAVGAGDSFELINSGMSSVGQPRLRMAQVHEGVPVFGADVVVHSRDAMFSSVRGNVMRDLEGFDVVPELAKEDAMASAKALYLSKVTDKVAQLSYSREKTNLVILPMDGGAAPRLAWHVQFFTEHQGGVEPMLLNAFFDAKTGELVKQFNGIHTLSQASGPGGNAKVPRTWNAELDVEPSGTQFMMDTARLRTTNMRNGTTGQGTIVTGPLSPIGDAAINDAHGYSEAVFNMLVDWQGENSINEAGFKLISRVHYSSNYENAFWDGTQMTYGDGATTFYPLSGSSDVAGHEINHGFTSFHSNLTYSGQSGGMNESFSDIAGEVTEAYIRNAAPDMLVGADIFKSATGALRYMCTPRDDGRSLDNFSQFTSGVDVHYSSGIMNKAFCLAARRFATGTTTGAVTLDSVKKVSRAFYVANNDFWTAGSTFLQGCAGTISAATQLGFTATEIGYLATSWNDVGVTGTGCTGTTTPPTGCTTVYTATGLPLSIPDNNATGITSNLAVANTSTITSVALSLNITHTYRGDLVVSLLSPTGTSYSVSNRSGGSADNIVLTEQAVSAFNGQSPNGTWQLKIQDRASRDTGRLNSWSIKVGRACPLN